MRRTKRDRSSAGERFDAADERAPGWGMSRRGAGGLATTSCARDTRGIARVRREGNERRRDARRRRDASRRFSNERFAATADARRASSSEGRNGRETHLRVFELVTPFRSNLASTSKHHISAEGAIVRACGRQSRADRCGVRVPTTTTANVCVCFKRVENRRARVDEFLVSNFSFNVPISTHHSFAPLNLVDPYSLSRLCTSRARRGV